MSRRYSAHAEARFREARGGGRKIAKFGDGTQIAVSAERSGIGGNFGLGTYRARVPVRSAQ
jgi:hypothetical protein